MTDNNKGQLLNSLKAMQTEITAIRYYNGKLASLKKQIATSNIDQSAYDTSKASRLIKERDRALASQKKPAVKKSILDVILFAVFAVFSVILMIMLYPGESIHTALAILNWVFLAYIMLFPVFLVVKSVTDIGKLYSGLSSAVKYTLWGLFAVSVAAYVVDGILRPIFFITACPLLLGWLMLWIKGKEDSKNAVKAHADEQMRTRANYDKLINEAVRSDESEKARLQADVEKERATKQKKYAAVIDECTKALAKHKAKFYEINILPAEVLKKDSGVVDTLIKALENGEADTLDSALAVWEKALLDREADFGEIYVSVALKRRDGWGDVRNMVYIDGAKVGTAEMPYKVFEAAPGTHSLTAKVQLNYGGASHYPQSEPVTLDIQSGEKKFVKFFVSGTPTVQSVICRDMDEFSAEL